MSAGFRPACRTADVPLGEGRTAVVDGMAVAIFHGEDGWAATAAACPHKNGPLADAILADDSITCPLHQRRFALGTGEPIGHDCPAVAVFDVEVHGDEVLVAVHARSAAVAA